MPRNNLAEDAPPMPERDAAGRFVKKRTSTQPVRSRRGDVDVDDSHVKQPHPRHMKTTGPASESLEPMDVQTVERMPSEDKLELLRFMEDELLVMVHDSTDPNDEPFPEVFNDGKVQRFIRGMEQRVKRKYVELLARSKITRYTQRLVKDANGIQSYRNTPHTALRFPFTVLHDPAGQKGADWLKQIREEGY